MADVVQTATSVHAHSGATVSMKEVGEAVVPGDWLYLDSADGKHKLAVGTDSAKAVVVGMSLGYGPADGNYVPVATAGDVDVGATLTVGGGPLIISSAAAGNMAPIADLTTGEYGSVLGIQVAADKFTINIKNATVASA